MHDTQPNVYTCIDSNPNREDHYIQKWLLQQWKKIPAAHKKNPSNNGSSHPSYNSHSLFKEQMFLPFNKEKPVTIKND